MVQGVPSPMRILRAVVDAFRPNAKVRTENRAESDTPGRSGPSATREIDPHRIGRVVTSYSPSTDGQADPGEVVWTWVPYEERDGRGKDRPVLVVARERSDTVLAVQLTSQAHPGRSEYLPIGAGAWDAQGRPSYVVLDRVFRVHQSGMRREAASLDARRFETVRAALVARYGWCA